jgi:ribonuclease III
LAGIMLVLLLENSINRSPDLRLFAALLRRTKASERNLKEAISNLFGYQPGNIAIYRLAFRHKSMASSHNNGYKHSNERLEYLGDAVLGSVIADFLFKKFPFKDEGFLTEMRARIVSRNHLNQLSRKLGLDKLIEASKENNVTTSSILGDAFEAFVGAMYLDKGYRFTQKIIISQIIQNHVDIEELLQTEINFKSKVIEWAQKEKKTVEFVLTEEIENGRKGKLYLVSLMINGKLISRGKDYSIKKAEQQASRLACDKIFDEQDSI